MRRSLFIGLLLSLACAVQAQERDNTAFIFDWFTNTDSVATGGGDDGELVYVDIPAPPSFNSPTTIDAATVGSSIESGELGGSTDILIPAIFNERLRPNGLVGTSGTPYRFKSESDDTRSWIGGSALTTGQQAVAMLNGSNYNYFYHLGIIGDPSEEVTGISGVALTALAGGAYNEFVDVRIRNTSFAGMQINNSTVDATYNIVLKFIAIDGYDVEGEGLYLGNTGTTGHARFLTSDIEHVIVTNKGRDGLQFNNHANLNVSNATVYIVGVADITGQNRLIQVQNCNGIVRNSLFWGAPSGFDVFAHGLTFENCIFYVTEASGGYLGKLTSIYTGSEQETNEPVKFINCHFGSAVSLTNWVTVVEDEADVIFENCTKDENVTNLYFDNRADKSTYSIIETGTTTEESVTPTFVVLDITDEEDHGKITTPYYYDLGIGYLTPSEDPEPQVAPTIQASNLSFSSVASTSMTVSWSNGNGDGVLVLAHEGAAVDANPVDSTRYSASSTFGSGDEIGTGNFVVYRGSDTAVSVSGLTAETEYHFRAYAYNALFSDVVFNTDTETDNPNAQTTTEASAGGDKTVLVSFGSSGNPAVTGDTRTWNYASTDNPDGSYSLTNLVDSENNIITGLDIDVTLALSDQNLGSDNAGSGDAEDFPAGSASEYWYPASGTRGFDLLIPEALRGTTFTISILSNKESGSPNNAMISINGVSHDLGDVTGDPDDVATEVVETTSGTTAIEIRTIDGTGLSPMNAMKITWTE